MYTVATMKLFNRFTYRASLAFVGLFVLFASISLFSCRPKEQGDITVYGLVGPSSVGMAKLFKESEAEGGESSRIKPGILPSVDIMAAKFAAGEAVAGILPPNVAAKLAQSGVDIQVAAVVGRGMLKLLGRGEILAGPQDLIGKTVQVVAPGSTPDYVFRRILLAYGIEDGKNITFDISLPTPEVSQALIAGRISMALLPEPFATMVQKAKPEIKPLFDIEKAWTEATGVSDYPMTVLAVSRSWAKENRKDLLYLLDAYEDSVQWVLENALEAAEIAEAAGLGIKAAAIADASPKSSYCFARAAEARAELEAL